MSSNQFSKRQTLQVCILLLALMLAACGGEQAPAATDAPPDVPTEQAALSTEVQEAQPGLLATPTENTTPRPTLDATQQAEADAAGFVPTLPIPLPGTLVASSTEDPDAGLVFDKVTLVVTGGASNVNNVIEVFQNGRVVRNGVTTNVSIEEIIALDTMLDEINFFGLQAAFLGPAPDPNSYRYSLTVLRGLSERLVNAQDGFMPVEFQTLLAKIIALGAPSGPGG